MKSTFFLSIFLWLSTNLGGCATTTMGVREAEISFPVEVVVSDLRQDEANLLLDELVAIEGLTGCQMERLGNMTTFQFSYRGDVRFLMADIAAIPHPGLRPGETSVRLSFEGFDNLPPSLDVLSPSTARTITEKNVEVVVEVPDVDVKKVLVNGKAAKKKANGLYRSKVQLTEGTNVIDILAVDNAGNETMDTVELIVDTTPPNLKTQIKVVITGHVEPGSTVFVEGRQIPVDGSGDWEAQIFVRKNQTTVEIIAIDENGNKNVENRSIFGK